MCRSIKTLRAPGLTAGTSDMSAAALQYVRKISGFHKPSKKNQEAFDRAVQEVAEATRRLLEALPRPDGDATEKAAPVAASSETVV